MPAQEDATIQPNLPTTIGRALRRAASDGRPDGAGRARFARMTPLPSQMLPSVAFDLPPRMPLPAPSWWPGEPARPGPTPTTAHDKCGSEIYQLDHERQE